ncbi:hypothetical protein [Erwinia rhapontici]|uniref:hypothetical protein n=1 Tax=Erwinia rhapontici TaxID=55212 RepID=UPI00105C5367|nr:hypothetical protein [Erwinia rhapontici]TDT01656.1 hypothetical protein EDF84_101383 [Erwinia rhapontici]
METEITPHQAEEMAFQAEIICSLLEDTPNRMTDMEVSAIAALLKKLTGSVASYLIEVNSQKQ